MPMIKGMVMKNFKAPENFVEFHSATKVPMEKRKDTVVHFFTPDFLFERVWYHPNKKSGVSSAIQSCMQPKLQSVHRYACSDADLEQLSQ